MTKLSVRLRRDICVPTTYIKDAERLEGEIERLCEELAAAQKDATRYWWVARNCDVWHATFGAIGSNRELDAAMAKESERE